MAIIRFERKTKIKLIFSPFLFRFRNLKLRPFRIIQVSNGIFHFMFMYHFIYFFICKHMKTQEDTEALCKNLLIALILTLFSNASNLCTRAETIETGGLRPFFKKKLGGEEIFSREKKRAKTFFTKKKLKFKIYFQKSHFWSSKSMLGHVTLLSYLVYNKYIINFITVFKAGFGRK